jgi:CRP-like cAMP-binding protein
MHTGNRLLDRLPSEVIARLKPDFTPVSLALHQVVHRPGEEIKFLYFPLTCMISVTVTMSDGRTVETGAVGSREVVGINAFMGGRATTQTEYIIQIPGEALKILAAPIIEEFDRNTSLRTALLKYTQAMIAQISQNVGCNRLHEVQSRCARWLMEVRDRMNSDSFGLTQEFIAEMLGTSRVTVSHSMSELKELGTIDYSRGHVEILDYSALEECSCECYFLLQEEYDRLLGPDLTQIDLRHQSASK